MAARRRRQGESLVEVLAASAVLAAVLPSVISAFSSSLAAEDRLRLFDACRYGVHWWMNRLEQNGSNLASMPRSTPDGSVSFEWLSADGSHRAELTVSAEGGEPRSFIIEF